MSELVVIERAEVVPTLDELRERIRKGHGNVLASVATTLELARDVGEALLAARNQCPYGQWLPFSKTLSIGNSQIYRYMRVAKYWDYVKSAPSINIAMKILDAPENKHPGDRPKKDRPWADDALRMQSAGMSISEIGDVLGLGKTSLMAVLHPEQRARMDEASRRRKLQITRDKHAAARARRAESADRAGGGISASFKQIRAAQQMLSNLSEAGATTEIKQAATLAYRAVCRAEDEIAKILADA